MIWARQESSEGIFSSSFGSPGSEATPGGFSMAVTVKDIAQLAGVSIATVSRVTSGGDNVSPETRDRVLDAISRLQYSPNAHAAQLARGSSGITRNGKPSKRSVPSGPRRRGPVPVPLSKEQRAHAERLRLLERENLRLKRQVSDLIGDLERWRTSLKRKIGA